MRVYWMHTDGRVENARYDYPKGWNYAENGPTPLPYLVQFGLDKCNGLPSPESRVED